MRTRQFWRDLVERALATLAQTLLGWLFIDQVIWELDWQQGLGIALTATVASILKSIAATGLGDPESASMISGGRHRAEE